MLLTDQFQVGNVAIGGDKLFLIAGPCVIESEDHAIKMAEAIAGVARALRVPYIFKASYDKANRTSLKSYRGPGISAGLRILKKTSQIVHLTVPTDFHGAVEVRRVADGAGMLQIPAFIGRQTSL